MAAIRERRSRGCCTPRCRASTRRCTVHRQRGASSTTRAATAHRGRRRSHRGRADYRRCGDPLGDVRLQFGRRRCRKDRSASRLGAHRADPPRRAGVQRARGHTSRSRARPAPVLDGGVLRIGESSIEIRRDGVRSAPAPCRAAPNRHRCRVRVRARDARDQPALGILGARRGRRRDLSRRATPSTAACRCITRPARSSPRQRTRGWRTARAPIAVPGNDVLGRSAALRRQHVVYYAGEMCRRLVDAPVVAGKKYAGALVRGLRHAARRCGDG